MPPLQLLIVDDEPVVLDSCRRILGSRDDISLTTVASGHACLEQMRARAHDIIITDLKMPGMDGLELLRQLRQQWPAAIAMVFTGHATVETARRALQLGAFDYIPKPFTPDELRTVIDNAASACRDRANTQMLDLMAIVSHDMQSPLSALHSSADCLDRGYFGKLEPRQQQMVDAILRNCHYLEDIIRAYIDLSQMDIDELACFHAPVDLAADVVMPVVAVPELRDNYNHMPLETSLTARPCIEGDPKLLRILLSNLINNAIKYGNPGTPVSISLTAIDDGWQLAVYNTGSGISRQDIETRLFQKFQRLKQPGTEGIKGTGLGLYICRVIAEKHQARIRAESDGSTWVRVSVTFQHGENTREH